MPLLLSTGFGLLVREFHRRVKPNNRAIPALTRGLYTATKRDVVRRKRAYQNDPFSIAECKQRLGGNCVRRHYSTPPNNEDWIPVYRYNRIFLYSMISRAKFFQTIFSVILVPYQTYLYIGGNLSTTTFIGSLVVASLAPIILIGFTRYFNRMIGVMSYNERGVVRFGYLGFWGGRKNLTVDVDDIMPLTDSYDVDSVKPIVKLDLKKHGFLLLSLNNCEIVDDEIAKEIFGNLKYFKQFEVSN